MSLKSPLAFFWVALLSLSAAAEQSNACASDWRKMPPIGLEAGDVIVRKGRGAWTHFFIAASTTEKRFSHVGIAVENPDGVCASIIHAEGNDLTGLGSVKIETWQQFFSAADEGAVFRYVAATNVPPLIAGNARLMLGVPFDPLFDMSNTNRLYCSEFVRLAVNRAVGENLVGFSKVCGRPVVAIDDIYRRNFSRIYDSKGDSRQSGKRSD